MKVLAKPKQVCQLGVGIFSITSYRSFVVPIFKGIALSVEDCSKSPIEMEDMNKVLYASFVGSLMHVIVCMRPKIVLKMEFLS